MSDDFKMINLPAEEDLENLLLQPYSDEELEMTPEMEEKIEKMIKFFDQYGINYKTFDKIRKAYPNEQYMHVPGAHNVEKWLQAVREIFAFERNGWDRASSVRKVTAGWKIPEIYDFLNWLKFYQEGAHLKYKVAQLWYENGTPGYFLQVKKDDNSSDMIDDKKRIIEQQRNKIIGRLDSAEKLLRSQEGQLFAGKEYEALMEIIYQLKKKIQLVNKVSSSEKTYQDLIIRESNILRRSGFNKAAGILYSLADGEILNPTSPEPPAQGSGSAGGLPSVGPGMPQNPPESAGNENSPIPQGISQFMDNLETGNIAVKDELEVEDSSMDELEIDDFISQAQDMKEIPVDLPPPESAPKKPVMPEKPSLEPLEVSEEDISEDTFDKKFDSMMSGLTIEDVVSELEDLAKIFKTREIPRRLARADMMLDGLGLASYFPALSEAQNKALEANNYISTRVDDIISKLRGSIDTREIDLRGDSEEEKPEIALLKKKLQQAEDKEKARKQMKKDQEISEKETPEIEVMEDLATPPTPKVPAVPVSPAPPAPVPPPVSRVP